MRRIALFALLSLVACKNEAAVTPAAAASAGGVPGGASNRPLRIGATKVPHGDLIRAVTADLKSQGVEVELKEFDDYAKANIAVARGDLDANFFQTEPYLWRWRAAHGAPLVVVGKVHVEPMAIYSKKLKALSELKAGDAIALPEDPSNLGRALSLLEGAGLIKRAEGRGLDAGIGDIAENKLGLKFRLEPAQKVPEQLGTVAAAVINGNFALQAKLDPRGALYSEGADSLFPNVVVAREDHAADARIKALVEALRSPASRELIGKKYAGAVIPAQ